MNLAEFFDKQREIIESAETPFAKLAVFVLPIVAPLVPAFMTGLHLYKLFIEMFQFDGSNILAGVLAFLIGSVLELLGYVGAVSFIQTIFIYLREKTQEYLIPAVLTALAYGFYLVLMALINVALGRYFKEPEIVTWIIGLLSFITVPTGLLSANNLAMKDDREIKSKGEQLQERRYQEARADKMEKYRINKGLVSYQQVSETLPNLRGESTYFTQILPNDWRKVRPLLNPGDVEKIARWTSTDMKKVALEQGKEERTLINWRKRCQVELGWIVESKE